MKPREFDELLRQKFEQNDFEYDSRNWDRLAERLGPSKKRSIALWWWMPLATGMAASVALAIGVISSWHGDTGNAGVAEFAKAFRYEQQQPVQFPQDAIQYSVNPDQQYATTNHKRKTTAKHIRNVEKETDFGIDLQNALSFTPATKQHKFDLLLDAVKDEKTKEKDKKKAVVVTEGYNTFKPEEIKKEPKVSVSLLGGFNQGSQSNGYLAGATIRKMVNDKVYIESDVAYASSNNTQPNWVNGPDVSAKHAAGKNTNSLDPKATPITPVEQPVEKSETYNLSYAQVSPSVGYKLMKRMSLAAGPDFQQALGDRPSVATNLTRDNVAVMPLFDVGLMGKTEYAVTKKIKAQLSYRKGINNVLTPMDKYIDRDYLQVQVRYTIFNK